MIPSLRGFGPSLLDSPALHLARSIMLTFDLILEHWQTGQIRFVTVEECVDLDDCIDCVKQSNPDFDIIQVKPV
jgi:hypothetical protein